MAQWRGERPARTIVELGKTAGGEGIDTRVIYREALAVGRFGVGLWDGNDHRLLISDAIATGSEAMIARHMHEQHRPVPLGSPEISVCETATCEQAQMWAVATAAAQIEAVSS